MRTIHKVIKLLAEWFWTDRWTASSAFLLPMEPRGLYREMLTQAWMRGARLPNDPEAIQRACGCTKAEWKRCWPKIEYYWRVDGPYLVNDTQLEIYHEAQKREAASSGRGRAGAEARWAAKREQSAGDAQASPEQWPPVSDLQSPISVHEGINRSISTRGKVFVGERLKVSQRQHEHLTDELGRYGGFIDLLALYPEWDKRLAESGEQFDTLDFLKARIAERVKALRAGGPMFQAQTNERGEDWFEECQRVHQGECGGSRLHVNRMIVEQARASGQ